MEMMRDLPNAKGKIFYGKSQFLAFQHLADWLRVNQETVVIAVSNDINGEDQETPHSVTVFLDQ